MNVSSKVDFQAISLSIDSHGKAHGVDSQHGANSGANTSAKTETKGTQGTVHGNRTPARRGFAAMNPARQKEIAAQGGRAAHESGNAHQFTVEEARAAGRKSHSARQQRASASASL